MSTAFLCTSTRSRNLVLARLSSSVDYPHIFFLSSICFLVYNQCLRDRYRRTTANWKPFDRVLVEEGPGRHDDHEGQGGASEAYEHGELDVLQEVSDEEGDALVEPPGKLAPPAFSIMPFFWAGGLTYTSDAEEDGRKQLRQLLPLKVLRQTHSPISLVLPITRISRPRQFVERKWAKNIRSAPRRYRGPGPGVARPWSRC